MNIYSIFCCDDTNNVGPRNTETINRSIELNGAMIMIILCIEMCQRFCEGQKYLGGQCPRMLSVATGPNVLLCLIKFKV